MKTIDDILHKLAEDTKSDLSIRQIAIEYIENNSIIEKGYFRSSENNWLSYILNKGAKK